MYEELIKEVFAECGLESYATDENARRFSTLCEMLIETNEHINITAVTDPRGIVLRHFADSVSAASLIPEGAAVIDVGCGGGFPALPLAIVRPDLEIVALDSTAKKLKFTERAARSLSLNVKTLTARAEETALLPERRERYDVCISRAVARLNVLCELCMPLVRVGGVFIAMKGSDADNELTEADNAIRVPGGKLAGVKRFRLSDAGERALITVEKVAHTPYDYPRQYAKIKKKPL